MSLLPLLAIVRKDLQVIAVDRRALFVLFAVPLFFASTLASLAGSVASGAGGPQAIGEEATAHLIRSIDRSDLPETEKDALAEIVGERTSPAGPAATLGLTQGDESKFVAHAFGGSAVQFLMFAGLEGGTAMLAERQRGLWKRPRASATSRATLLFARAISTTIIGLLVLTALLGFGGLAFGLRVKGSLLGLVGVALGFAMTSASFGLLIAAVGKTPQAARGIAAIVVLVMVTLGGAWMPTTAFPPWLRRLTPLVPTRWAVDGFDAALAAGWTLGQSLPAILALAVFAATFGLLASLTFRWDP